MNKKTFSINMRPFKFKKYVNSENNLNADPLWKRILSHRFFRLALGVAAGGIAGLLYWKFVGCHSGSCPLTSNPYKTVILFSFMGGLLTHRKKTEQDAAK
jgi:hypothetical protein